MGLLARVTVILTLLIGSTLFASVGKVSLLKGEAYAQREAQKISLQNGAILEEKDIITTAKNAQLQLIFEDKTVITLGSESELKIEEYFNDAAKPKAKFKFGEGSFKSITGQIGKTAPENFTLETKTATIGIRGTTVAGIIPPPSSPTPETLFCLSGQIAVGQLVNPSAPPVILPAGSITFVSPSAPPTPPRPATQQELQHVNQSTGGGAPAPAANNSAGGSASSSSSGDSPTNSEGSAPSPAPSPTPPAPQTFVPAAATSASQTNLQTNSQTQVQTQVQLQTCPTGQSGIYPNCGTCTALQTGTYPNCVDRTCEAGTTGTYPNCVPLTCSAGQSGTYPNCTDNPPTLPSIPDTCPAGTTGTYPNCVSLTCPAGQSGIYPNCGTCTALQTGTYPNCVNKTCAAGTTGTYPNCVAQTCPDGTTGTPPNCTQISSPLVLSGLTTSSKGTSSTEYTHNNDFIVTVTNAAASGAIDFVYPQTGSGLSFSSTTVNMTEPTIFTVETFGQGITQFSSIASPVSNVLWGKWTSSEISNGNTLLATENNYWVAGRTTDKEAAVLHLDNLYGYINQYTTYTYSGKSMGTVYNAVGQAFAIDPVNDLTNEVKLVFQFGNSAAPMTSASHIRFTANGYWDITTYPGQAGALADGSFWAMLSGTGTIGGSLNGYFYGANAASLGGTFKATNPDTSSTAIGAFVASKSGTVTTLSGLGTSIYNHLDVDGYVDGTVYSDQDALAFLLTDLSYISGSITLNRAPSDPPIGEQAMNSSTTSINTFGPNSAYLYWGNWTSSAVGDNNSTLIHNEDNFWVAGTHKVDAANYISNLISDPKTPILTYKGNVIGNTYDSSGNKFAILEDANNKVVLKFNLGESNPVDEINSLITFNSNGDLWNLRPSNAYLAGGTFSASFDPDHSHIFDDGGNRRNVSYGCLSGNFYGPYADAAGGTFQATDFNNITALGIFKTLKTSTFYYPSFDPDLFTRVAPVGNFNLSGFATSEYIDNGVRYFSTSDTLSLNINTMSSIPIVVGSIGSFSLDSTLDGGINKMTYLNNNDFAIKDFDAEKGWMIADNTLVNDYVAWGYWAVNSSNNAVLTSKTNYWVGGSPTDSLAAASYIDGLTTNTYYSYHGKVIGDVEEEGWRHVINSSTSSVQLKFDFGGGTNALYSDPADSWIRFSANGKDWDLKPTLTTPTVTDGFFSDGLTGTVTGTLVVPVISGAMQGQFYGSEAQAIGGTFNASTSTATAIGVFKGTRALSYYLEGFGTSSYTGMDGVYYGTANPLTLDISDSIFTSNISLRDADNDLTVTGAFSLNGTGSTSSMNDFNNTKIWTDKTYPNDYVSWGYWAATDMNSSATLMAGTNYWVAGKDSTAAAAYVASLIADTPTTQYRYDGQSIGFVMNESTSMRSEIDPVTNNAVRLNFDFGGGAGSLTSGSYIKFQTLDATPQSWKLSPSGAIPSDGTTFSVSNSNSVKIDNVTISPSISIVKGQFFGTQAQGIGGTFKASATPGATYTAVGVFKGTGGISIP